MPKLQNLLIPLIAAVAPSSAFRGRITGRRVPTRTTINRVGAGRNYSIAGFFPFPGIFFCFSTEKARTPAA
jgi:hypothetical protein